MAFINRNLSSKVHIVTHKLSNLSNDFGNFSGVIAKSCFLRRGNPEKKLG
jgi:hypothetical protein